MRWLGDLVRRADRRAAGVPVVELPRRQPRPSASTPALTSITPAGRKYPYENSSLRVHTSLTGLPAAFASRAASTAYSPAVLAAVGGPGVRHDDAHAILGHAERRGQLGADAERPLRAGPDGELAVDPFRDRGARLERHVRDVGDAIAGVERAGRGGARGGDVAGRNGRAAAPPLLTRPRLLEMLVDRRGRRQAGRHAPLGADGGRGAAREAFRRRDDAGEVAVADDDHAPARLARTADRRARRACRCSPRTNHPAVQHPGPREVGRVAMARRSRSPGRRPSLRPCRGAVHCAGWRHRRIGGERSPRASGP